MSSDCSPHKTALRLVTCPVCVQALWHDRHLHYWLARDDIVIEPEQRLCTAPRAMFIICCYGVRCSSSSMTMKRVVHPLLATPFSDPPSNAGRQLACDTLTEWSRHLNCPTNHLQWLRQGTSSEFMASWGPCPPTLFEDSLVDKTKWSFWLMPFRCLPHWESQ